MARDTDETVAALIREFVDAFVEMCLPLSVKRVSTPPHGDRHSQKDMLESE